MKTNHFFRTLVLSIFILISFKIKAQSTDFNMSYNGHCTSVTIEVLDASSNSLWSGSPFTGTTCITGTPAFIKITDGTCNSFTYPVNGTFQKVAPPPDPQCTCLFYTADRNPHVFGFFAQHVTSGGNCNQPFISGILTVTLFPECFPNPCQ